MSCHVPMMKHNEQQKNDVSLDASNWSLVLDLSPLATLYCTALCAYSIDAHSAWEYGIVFHSWLFSVKM
jgi:hypothetical protein